MTNSINSNMLLTQLRTMASQAGMKDAPAASKVEDSVPTDFTEILKTSLEHLNERSENAKNMAIAFERGDPNVELSQVMIEMQKARISFETLSQVRNKMVSAYQEIMNMPI